VFFSNFVPKMHRFWDIRLLSIQWPWNPGWGHSRSSKIIPFNPAPMTSYYHSIVTIGLSRSVSEINGDFRWKPQENRQFFPSLCIWRPQDTRRSFTSVHKWWPANVRCRRIRSTRPPNGKPWRFHRATDQSEDRRQSILRRSYSSVE